MTAASPLLVVGDALLDHDVCGRADRLAPDAPVPVVDGIRRTSRPGGAALAAWLAAADGRSVTFVTALGDDEASAELVRLLGDRVRLIRLPLDGALSSKTRILAEDRPLLRLDDGDGRARDRTDEACRAIADAGAVLVSDYGRGTADVLRDALAGAAARVPVVWDPHPRGGPPVPGVRLATPSASEARSFAATASGGTAPQGAAQEGAESRRVAQARAFGGATAPQHAVREGAGGRPTRPSVADARAFAGAEHGGSTASQDAAQDGAGGRPVADAGAFADAEPGSSTASQGAAQEGTAGRPTGPSDAEARALGGAGSRGSAAFQWAARDAAALVRAWRAASVVVTLGGRGALLSHGETPLLLPSPVTAEGDACGAGDRFAATAAGLLADGELTERAVRGAVHAATRYVAEGGVRSLSSPAEGARPVPTAEDDALGMAARVRAAGGTVVAAGGCFDLLHAGHVSLLEAARRAGDCLVVCVNSDASVSRRKGPGRPLVRLADRIRVLRALECVDAVAVFDEDTPERLLAELRPHIWAKGGDYALARLPEASLVESWGGQVVLFPYLDGRSTTNLARRAASGPRLVGRERR